MPGRSRKCVDVNVMGVVHGLAAVLPGMVARRHGRVAIMGSLAGYGGVPASAAYGATKAALINLAASLRMDLDGAGVVVPGDQSRLRRNAAQREEADRCRS